MITHFIPYDTYGVAPSVEETHFLKSNTHLYTTVGNIYSM